MKGKITEVEVEQLKNMHGKSPTGSNIALHKWVAGDKKDDVVFKAMTHDLMKVIRSMINDSAAKGAPYPVEEVNDKIFDSCVLWPRLTIEEKLNLPVGTPSSVVKAIQEKSGFIEIDVMGRAYGPDIYTSVVQDYNFWPDIDETEAEELKKSTPFHLHKAIIGKWIFIIRPMTRSDIQIADAAIDDALTLTRAITMWPKKIEWDIVPSGIIENLGRVANKISGWDDSSTVESL